MTAHWEHYGEIAMENGALSMRGIPSDRGLYKLTFPSGAVYIGEAADVRRRIGDYLIYYESTGIESEFRINSRLRKEGGARIDLLLSNEFSTRSARCQREHAELKLMKESLASNGRSADLLLNGGSIRDRIMFYEAEIERLKKRLHRQELAAGDMDEAMHADLLSNEQANLTADKLAVEAAREAGLSDKQIRSLHITAIEL